MTYYVGDTLRLTATFYTFAGVLADPTTVVVNIYDINRTLLVTAAAATKDSTGVYHYDYTTTVEGRLAVEFTGTLETKTVLTRTAFTVSWV